MERIVTLFIIPLFVVAEPDIVQITAKLLMARRFVHPENRSTILYYQQDLNPSTEAVLTRFLRVSSVAMFIASNGDAYSKVYQTLFYPILFVDKMDPEVYLVLNTNNRQIIVTSKTMFSAIVNDCQHLNKIFIVWDDYQWPIYHYNQYLKTVHKYTELQWDPLIAATNDLAGHSFALSVQDPIHTRFVEDFVSKTNGTHTGYPASYTLSFIPLQLGLMTIFWYLPVYMHRSENLYALVPRLNRPIPTMYILTDPFDIPIWILILGMILTLACVRIYLNKVYTVKSFLKNVSSVVITFTVGSDATFSRELDRQLSGLILLTSVVLVNAYQSMVISYLLSPRFYPELDTLHLLNESCCWDRSEIVDWYKFKQKDHCPSTFMFDHWSLNSLMQISKLHRKMVCTTIDRWEKTKLDQRPPPVLTSGLYRWSKQTVNEVPLLAWIQGACVITERMIALSGQYFAEGALSSTFEAAFDRPGGRPGQQSLLKATSNEMLSIVWRIYGAGMALAVVVFSTELAREFYTCSKVLTGIYSNCLANILRCIVRKRKR